MTASDALLAAFSEARGEPIASDAGERICGELHGALDVGREAWPGVAIDAAMWARALAVVAPAPLPAEAPFAQIAIADLYLAQACSVGDPAAVAACDALLVREGALAAGAARVADSLRDEAVQIVRATALSPRPDRPAAIRDYAGRGPLRGWLRVLVARELIRLAKAQSRAVALEDHLIDLPAVDDDPVMEALKARYRTELGDAFRAALDELSSRDRTLLRYQLVDGLTIDDIAKLYRVHRATAARWLVAIRDDLVERTRAKLAASLGVDTVEAASIVRMVQSQLEVSVIRHLQPRRRVR